ncbi:Hypothetical predicted protein [Octopus vulgaris]|uniref:Uncharacterized protein n=1 Tax=Octopus vulgaris TaxID=6645 RepID=A0AA36BN93_OCTVU|nr:Hypothetical predicted protein [Octopus vulgaris]
MNTRRCRQVKKRRCRQEKRGAVAEEKEAASPKKMIGKAGSQHKAQRKGANIASDFAPSNSASSQNFEGGT